MGCLFVLLLASRTLSIWIGLWLMIPCIANMVDVSYFLFSSYGIPSGVGKVLWILDSGMRRYLEIAVFGFQDVSVWVPMPSPRQLFECPKVLNVS